MFLRFNRVWQIPKILKEKREIVNTHTERYKMNPGKAKKVDIAGHVHNIWRTNCFYSDSWY